MSFNIGVIEAAVALDDTEYRKKLQGLESTSADTFKRIVKYAEVYLSGRALFGFVQDAMSEFSKLEEGNNKLKYTFTEIQNKASATADVIAEKYNLASSTATNAIADIGDMLTGLGFSQSQQLDFAKQITERGIDVASFKGLDQTDVIRRMTAALTGETESLKAMGVVIRQGSDEFNHQLKSIMQTTGATETMAKAQVILQDIIRQTANAEGDYLRPDAPRTYAQEISDLREAVKQFKTEIGTWAQPFTQETVARARELLSGYNNLSRQTKDLINNTLLCTGAIVALNKANLLSAGGLTVLSKGFKAATLAAKGFFASIGPIGWAIMALSAAYMAVKYVIDKKTEALEKNTAAQEKNANAQKETYQENEKLRDAETDSLKRLQELAQYERLSNTEKEEAIKLIQQLREKNKDLGIIFDEASGKIIGVSEAYEKLKKSQDQQRKDELATVQENALIEAKNQAKSLDFFNRFGFQNFKKESKLNDFNIYSKTLLNDKDELERLHTLTTALLKDSSFNKDASINKYVDSLKTFAKAQLQVIGEIKEEEGKEVTQTSIEDLQKINNSFRKSLSELEGTKIDIEFDSADAQKKIEILENKVQDLFSKNFRGKFNDLDSVLASPEESFNEQEIESLKEILKLQYEKEKIVKRSADAARDEQLAYQEMIANQKKTEEEYAIGRQIEYFKENNDKYSALAIMYSQLQNAQDLANSMRIQYANAARIANEDSILTEEERAKLQEIRSQMQSAFSESMKWQSEIDRMNESESGMRSTAQAISAWSSALLDAQLFGPSKPEEETAKNTKKSMEYLRDINRNIVEQINNSGEILA